VLSPARAGSLIDGSAEVMHHFSLRSTAPFEMVRGGAASPVSIMRRGSIQSAPGCATIRRAHDFCGEPGMDRRNTRGRNARGCLYGCRELDLGVRSVLGRLAGRATRWFTATAPNYRGATTRRLPLSTR